MDDWLKHLLVWWLKMAIYYFCHSFNISWRSFVKNFPAHFPFKSYNFIINGSKSISMISGISEIITACVRVPIWHYSFRGSDCPTLADSPFELAPLSLWHTPYILAGAHIPGSARFWEKPLPQEPWLLLVNDRHQDGGSGVLVATGVTHCFWGPFSGQS